MVHYGYSLMYPYLSSMFPIISTSELLAFRENVLLADVSGNPQARENYKQEHLQGAIFVDTNTDLADIKADFANGGRHPLPTPEQFSETLGKLGITPETHVVLYDNLSGANAAARFWWMLRAVGHEKVQVLDGGFAAAKAGGFPTESGAVEPNSATHYPISQWQLSIKNMSEVEQATKDSDCLIIDVRDEGRYAGEFEPIDTIAGHIPNAINVPFKRNLNQNGLFLSPQELRNHFEQVTDGKPSDRVIVHCGSGVTACHTLLAMSIAEMDIPNLYVGSWSEWSRNGKEMITKE